MERLIFTLTPKTAFATPLAGDTLFGQCCWALRHLFGEEKLTQLLTGYTENKPFLVISDAMPQGFLSRPTLPSELLGFDNANTKERKIQKAKKWFPISVLSKPINQWESSALTEHQMLETLRLKGHFLKTHAQDHNSLSRLTGTTGTTEGFAPFQRQTFWYHPDIRLTLVVELDTTRLSIAALNDAFAWMGWHGYGKEASCGLGKFDIEQATCATYTQANNANAWLTLAPCAPQGLHWNSNRCYYEVLTRFGRHGDIAVHQKGGVFKNPVLMAKTGAVLTPNVIDSVHRFTGQGITGVSKTILTTVHQGYAPVYSVRLENE